MPLRIPKELEYPAYGMNDLDSTELIQQHYSKRLINAYPGLSVKPRYGCTEVYGLSGSDGSANNMDVMRYRPESIGYEHLGKKYILAWCYGVVGGSTRHMIVAHNITDEATQYLDVGVFSEAEIHVSFLKLYKSVYVAIERAYSSNITEQYRDISKILWVDDLGTWHTREMGINTSPQIQSFDVVNSEGFGLFHGRSLYGAVVWNNSLWVVGGINSDGVLNSVYSSADGNLWVQQTVEARELMWDGESGEAVTDENGEQYYTASAIPYRYDHKLVVFDEKLWLFGGRDDATVYQDAWYTEDGVLWYCYGKDLGYGARYGFGIVEHSGELFIVGGFDSTDTALADVWSSADGITWAEVTQVAGFTARGGHAVWEYSGSMWIHGGAGTTDILSSTDGATWAVVVADAGLGSRIGHGVAVYNGVMWCVGGADGVVPQNDVYSSSDGVTWSLVQGTAAFSARYNFSIQVFLDELYVICGYTGAAWPEDIYHSNDGITWTATSTGIQANQYYDYTATIVRRTDEYAELDTITNFIYEPWETINSQLIVGVDEELLDGTVSLSGTALTGVGTAFLTNLSAGAFVRINGVPKYFEVDSVTDDTNAVLLNPDGSSFTDSRMVTLPAVGDSISTYVYQPGEAEGVEDINYRRLIFTYSSATYCRIFITIPQLLSAQAKGGTHVRLYRTLKATSATVAQGLSHRYLKDVALGNATIFRDDTSDDTLAGVTYSIEVTGMYAAPAGRFCFWAGGRMWIGGNPDKKGFWFASTAPTNTQYPDKYASLFDLENDWKSCDPDDNQKDTAGFEFLGDAYFCKERKIFWLSAASLNNQPVQISYHIGVAFPNSVAFGVDPVDLKPAVYFMSESGPAILKAGGDIRLLFEFKISDLWHWKSGLIKDSVGEATDWHTRNTVFGTFWNSAYWLFYGDSEDTASQLSTNAVVGCRFTEDGQSKGAFKTEFNWLTGGTEGIFEPQFIVLFDNITAYAVSHKSYGSAWSHRVVRFLDQKTFVDTFVEGSATINTQWETRPIWSGALREMQSIVQRILLRMRFGDTDGLVVTIYADESRHVVPTTYVQTRESGVTVAGSTAYRKSIVINAKDGILGSFFTIFINKTVPTTGDFEIFSPELLVEPVSNEAEFQGAGGVVPALTYVENANADPEVDAFPT